MPPVAKLIAEQLDDRDADDLEYERTGHTVFVFPPAGMAGPECEGAGWYE